MRLSLVVGLYNMRREIPRSLATMSSSHQQVPATDYEIILVDNGSSDPPDVGALEGVAENVHYRYVTDASASPTEAINRAVAESTGDLVTVVIDGARMFSPGVLHKVFDAFEIYDDPFVYAPSLHLGPQLQNDSSYGGYDQHREDALLASVDWRIDGYSLFDISNIAAVPERLAKPTFESNCFTVRRSTWDRLGGYHPGFADSIGGGIANWELFARYMRAPEIQPVLLVGEATFHQFHGGASTNQPRSGHPIRDWLAEHQDIFGSAYAWPSYEPVLFGQARAPITRSLYEDNVQAHMALQRQLSGAGDHEAAIGIARQLCLRFPHDPGKLQLLAEAFDRSSRRAEALRTIDEALTIAPTQAELHVTRGVISVGLVDYRAARDSYNRAIELDELLPEAFFHRAHLSLREGDRASAIADFDQAIALEPVPPAHYHADRAAAAAVDVVDVETDDDDHPTLAAMRDRIVRFRDSVQAHYSDQLEPETIDEHCLGGSFGEADLTGLHDIVAGVSPGRLLVIGGFLGLSTHVLVAATESTGSSIVVIDPNVRHRVFNSPLDHARTFEASDRVHYLDGFFGLRTDGGCMYDLQHFEPMQAEEAARSVVTQVPIVRPNQSFDLVLIDGDSGTEAEIATHVLPLLAPQAVLVFAGAHHGVLADLIAHGAERSTSTRVPIEGGAGFAVVRTA